MKPMQHDVNMMWINPGACIFLWTNFWSISVHLTSPSRNPPWTSIKKPATLAWRESEPERLSERHPLGWSPHPDGHGSAVNALLAWASNDAHNQGEDSAWKPLQDVGTNWPLTMPSSPEKKKKNTKQNKTNCPLQLSCVRSLLQITVVDQPEINIHHVPDSASATNKWWILISLEKWSWIMVNYSRC